MAHDQTSPKGDHEATIGEAQGEVINLQPNLTDINAHLHTLFHPNFVMSYPDAWIEIAIADPKTDKGPNASKHFTAFQLEEAAEYAARRNREGKNVYIGVALRQGDTGPSGRARKENVITASRAWADFDKAGDRANVQTFLYQRGLQTSETVMTGTIPNIRFQVFFKLSGDVTPEQLEAINEVMVSSLGGNGDGVQNADRLMRLAGTVSYPPPKKAARSYVPELTKLYANPNPRSYQPDELIELIRGKPEPYLAHNKIKSSSKTKTNGSSNVYQQFAAEAAHKPGRSDSELEALLEKSRKEGEWHNAIMKAIATLIGRGLSDDTIRIICKPYCREGYGEPEIDDFIDRGREKWGIPDEGDVDTVTATEKATTVATAAEAWDPWRETPAPKLDHSLLPAAVRKAAEISSEVSGADADAFAIAYLVGLAACGDTRLQITPKQFADDWSVPLLLWVILVAPPSSMKTAVINAARSLPGSLDAAERLRYVREAADAKLGALLTASNLAEGVETKKPTKTEQKQAITEAIKDVDPPRQRACGDITIEKYADLLGVNPGGVSMFRDELSGWLGALGKYTANGTDAADRAFYCALRDGSPHTRQRMTSPNIHIEHCAGSFMGAVQPDRLREMSLPMADGLLQRFLPQIMREARDYADVEDPDDAKSVLRPVRDRLAAMLPVMERDGYGQPRAVPYRLGREGAELYKAFASDMRIAGRAQDPSREFAECLNKMGPMWLSIALLFHLIETEDRKKPSRIVPIEVARRADAIIRRFFIPHAEQFYEKLEGGGKAFSKVQSVAYAILRCPKDDLVLRDVVHRCKAIRGMDRDVQVKLMQRFETHGWLTRTDRPGNAVQRWRRTPGLVERFAAELEREEAARAAVTAAIKADGGASEPKP